MEKNRFFLTSIILFLGWLSIPAQPVQVDTRSKVSAVTVYPDRAMVNRQWQQVFKPGVYSLNFSHLPVTLIDRSVRVSGKGGAEAVILNVKVERDTLTTAFKQEMRDLEQEKGRYQEQILRVQDRLKALGKREKFLLSLSEQTVEALSNAKQISQISLKEHQQNLDFLENQLNQVYQRQRQLKKQQRDFKEKVALIQGKFEKNQQKRRKAEKKIMVDIEVKKGGDLRLEVAYMLREASWKPTYDLRFNSTGKGASLTYGALVQQKTGEDWKNVRLTLSTARLMVYRSVPELKPQYFNGPNTGGIGMIRGLVELADGGPVPGVAVTLYRHGSSWKKTVSDENGRFVFIYVPAGSYNLRCDLESFKSGQIKNLLVYGNKITLPKITMETGTIQQEIVVSGEAPVIDMRNSGTSYNYPREFWSSLGRSGSGGRSYSSGSGSREQRISKLDSSISMKDIAKALGVEKSFMKSQGISTTFSLKHRETVLSTDRFQKVTVFINPVEVKLEHLAIPKLSDFAFLKAKAKNSTKVPLLAGKVDLFYDGAFVNTSHLDFKNPGESFELPVGVDETLRLERKVLEIKSKNKGLFKKKTVRKLGYTIKIKNFKNRPALLTVLDQIPVSHDKKVKVTITSVKPAAQVEKEIKKDGIRKWQMLIQPGAEKLIEVKYIVTSPKNYMIQEGD